MNSPDCLLLVCLFSVDILNHFQCVPHEMSLGASKKATSPDEAKWKEREDRAKKKAEDKRRALENQ